KFGKMRPDVGIGKSTDEDKNMDSTFEQLYLRLCKSQSYEENQIIFKALRLEMSLRDLREDLREALQQQFDANQWGNLLRLIFLVQGSIEISPKGLIHRGYPDRKFTSFLCNLLDNHRHDIFMEAIVDALFDIADERSVPSLINALECSLPGDDDYHFNRKIIQALF